MSSPFSDAWVQALVEATSDRSSVTGLGGIVGLGIGKTTSVVLEVADGRIMGESASEPAVTVPFAPSQVDAWHAGELVLSEAYMKGDLKPVGATGPLLAVLEILDDRTVVSRLVDQLG